MVQATHTKDATRDRTSVFISGTLASGLAVLHNFATQINPAVARYLFALRVSIDASVLNRLTLLKICIHSYLLLHNLVEQFASRDEFTY